MSPVLFGDLREPGTALHRRQNIVLPTTGNILCDIGANLAKSDFHATSIPIVRRANENQARGRLEDAFVLWIVLYVDKNLLDENDSTTVAHKNERPFRMLPEEIVSYKEAKVSGFTHLCFSAHSSSKHCATSTTKDSFHMLNARLELYS